MCCGVAIVLISGGGWGKRAGLGRRSHLELKRRLNLELRSALAGGGRGVVVLMKLVGRTRGLADRGGRREGLVLRGLELKRGLHLELKGVDLVFVERRQQGDDEW